MSTQAYKEVFAIIPGRDGKKDFWNRIGVAFPNSDGSLNIKFALLPADLVNTTIQVRDPRPRDEDDRSEGGSHEGR